METYAVANDAEAKALHEGTQAMIVVPMDAQPIYCEPPYVPGDVVGVKEAWRTMGNCYRRKFGPQIAYRSDGAVEWCRCETHFADDKELMVYLTGKMEWQEPNTMPDWAIRTRLSIVSVEAKRMQEITSLWAWFYTVQREKHAMENNMKKTQHTAGPSLREIAKSLEETMRCCCDLDRWEPELSTGHSWVCPIHKAALKAAGIGE